MTDTAQNKIDVIVDGMLSGGVLDLFAAVVYKEVPTDTDNLLLVSFFLLINLIFYTLISVVLSEWLS